MADQDIKSKITIESDVRGATKADRALKDVKKSSEGLERGGKNLQKQFDNITGEGSSLKDAIEGIGQASRGGTDSIFGLAKAARSLWVVISNAAPFIRIISILGAIAAAAYTLYQRFGDAEKGARDAGDAMDETSVKADTLADKLEELGTMSEQDIAKAVKEAADELTRAVGEAEKLRDRLASLEDAELARDLAEIDQNIAAGIIDPDAAGIQKASRIRQSELLKQQIQRETLDQEEQLAIERANQARNRAEMERGELEDLRRRFQYEREASGGLSVDDAEKQLAEAIATFKNIENNPLLRGLPQQNEAEAAVRIASDRLVAARNATSLQNQIRVQDGILNESVAVADDRETDAKVRIDEINARRNILDIQQQTTNFKFRSQANGPRLRQTLPERTPDDLFDSLRGNVESARRYQGQTYRGGQLGAEAQREARDAITAAEQGRTTIEELGRTLREIGVVFKDMGQVREDVQELRRQLENSQR